MNRAELDQRERKRREVAVIFACILSLIAFTVLGYYAHHTAAITLDVRFERWLQTIDWRALRWATDASNWAMGGRPLTTIALILTLTVLWRRWPVDAAVLAIATLGRLVNAYLKTVIESPRPTPELVRITDHSSGFGYPSGHAAGALLVIGAAAWIAARHTRDPARRRLIWLGAAAWILLTGVGRIYAGAHWPSDVIGAWLWSVPALVGLTSLATMRGERGHRTW
jgi:undecaprenyl-diphosphatase